MHAILCYQREEILEQWTPEHEATVMTNLQAAEQRIAARHKIGPVARLMPTRHAKTLRKERSPSYVIDGPFAETKEHLLGFYVIDCASMDDALAAARELGDVNPGGAYEVRPLLLFRSGAE
jgi:hypothetical protein